MPDLKAMKAQDILRLPAESLIQFTTMDQYRRRSHRLRLVDPEPTPPKEGAAKAGDLDANGNWRPYYFKEWKRAHVFRALSPVTFKAGEEFATDHVFPKMREDPKLVDLGESSASRRTDPHHATAGDSEPKARGKK